MVWGRRGGADRTVVGMLEVLGSFRAEWKGLDSGTRLPQVSSLEVKKERSAALSLEAREVIKSGPDEDRKSSCHRWSMCPCKLCKSGHYLQEKNLPNPLLLLVLQWLR